MVAVRGLVALQDPQVECAAQDIQQEFGNDARR